MQKNVKESILEKDYLKVGDRLYLRYFSGDFMVDIVKYPFTVIEVNKTTIKVQKCQLVFSDPRYCDTIADEIHADPTGEIKELVWHSERGLWGAKESDSNYQEYAIFGEWVHQPQLRLF